MAEEREGGLVLRSLESIGTSAGWFVAQLKARRLSLVGNAAMHAALATLEDLRSRTLGGKTLSFKSAEETYNYFTEATGADFLTKAIHWGFDAGLVLPTTGGNYCDPEIRSSPEFRQNPRANATRPGKS